MRVVEFTTKIIIGVIITVIGGIILAWALASPRSDIWITLDWVTVKRLPSIDPSEMQKLMDAAEIPANPKAEPFRYAYSVTLAELKLENTSTVTANNVEIHANKAYFVFDNKNTPQLYRPNADGLISIGQLRPADSRTLYILSDEFGFFDLSESVRVISDGVAVPVYVAKSFHTLPWTSYIVRNLNNSFVAETIAYLSICLTIFIIISIPFAIYARCNQGFRISQMTSTQRRTILRDAEFIREHYKLDTLVFDEDLKKQSQNDIQHNS